MADYTRYVIPILPLHRATNNSAGYMPGSSEGNWTTADADAAHMAFICQKHTGGEDIFGMGLI